MNLLAAYTYLQVLDFLTTLAFLLSGVQEGNPVVRGAMVLLGAPWLGLASVKVVALGLGFVCWRGGRFRLLMFANLFFACLVAWNLVALIAGLSR
ncbi:MAG: DUF5658 family protein [Bryobacteraceae bacterium]|nr:DUF5658 family protein [Bryobacteraceae bacterium]